MNSTAFCDPSAPSLVNAAPAIQAIYEATKMTNPHPVVLRP